MSIDAPATAPQRPEGAGPMVAELVLSFLAAIGKPLSQGR